MKRALVGSITAAVLFLAAFQPAGGEVFVLTTGGRLTGQLLNPDESPREKFVIRTPNGARVTLDRSQVEQILHPPPDELQYEKIRATYPDTVQGQWALAEWCREHRLTAQRKVHLERVIELDPDHAKARAVLGYHPIGGRWVTQEQIMAERGLIKYKGRWRTAQEIELMEQRRKTELAEKEWAQKLKRWRGWLGTDREPDGRRNILAIDDPHAVAALARSLESDTSQDAKVLYVEVLAKIGTPRAIKTLAQCSMEDRTEEVRLTCLDFLEPKSNPDLVTYYVGKLGDKDNRVVNLAAVALRRLKDPSAIRPLIDALVTTHKYKVSAGSPGSISTTFGTGPGGTGAPGPSGLSMGGRPKILKVPRRNQAVLDALVTLTGQNFNFDQRAWTYWYSAQKQRASFDVRRD